MLLHVAIGDAYGAGFEYANPDLVRVNNLKRYYGHPKATFNSTHKPGDYTDDTQMSIANAETILNIENPKGEDYARSYFTCFKRDYRDGYARRFQKFLEEVETPEEFISRIQPTSDKSGAAMRATVFGVYPTVEQVKHNTLIQAKVTHDTQGGCDSALASALMAHYFIYKKGPKENLGLFLESNVPGYLWSEDWTSRVGSKGMESIHAAVAAVQRENSMSKILLRSVDYTGDVDTVAASALGSAWASDEVEQDLPSFLYTDLENGQYGMKHLIELDRQLFSKFNLMHLKYPFMDIVP